MGINNKYSLCVKQTCDRYVAGNKYIPVMSQSMVDNSYCNGCEKEDWCVWYQDEKHTMDIYNCELRPTEPPTTTQNPCNKNLLRDVCKYDEESYDQCMWELEMECDEYK